MLTSGEWEALRHRLGLTRRECEVVQAVFSGAPAVRAGEVLGVSQHTVQTYLKRVYTKLGVHSKPELVVRIVDEWRSLASDDRL